VELDDEVEDEPELGEAVAVAGAMLPARDPEAVPEAVPEAAGEGEAAPGSSWETTPAMPAAARVATPATHRATRRGRLKAAARRLDASEVGGGTGVTLMPGILASPPVEALKADLAFPVPHPVPGGGVRVERGGKPRPPWPESGQMTTVCEILSVS
jgi:hypothetical protein